MKAGHFFTSYKHRACYPSPAALTLVTSDAASLIPKPWEHGGVSTGSRRCVHSSIKV